MDFTDFMIKQSENEKAKIEYLNKVYDKVNEAMEEYKRKFYEKKDGEVDET